MHPPSVDPTERLFNPQTVCVWASGVYIARAFDPSVPGTTAEVLALAADSGVPGGASGNYAQLQPGMKKRYGLVGTLVDHQGGPAAQAAVLAAAAAGPIAVALAGDMYNLTPRWQNGHTGHSIAVLYEHGPVGVQFDPLAPAGYPGDPFPPAELANFATAALIFKEELVTTITLTPIASTTWSTKGGPLTGYKIGSAPVTQNFKAGSPAACDAIVTKIDPLPTGWPVGPYLRVTSGGFAGFLVPQSAVNFTAPDPCGPAVTAATAALNARLSSIAKIAAG